MEHSLFTLLYNLSYSGMNQIQNLLLFLTSISYSVATTTFTQCRSQNHNLSLISIPEQQLLHKTHARTTPSY